MKLPNDFFLSTFSQPTKAPGIAIEHGLVELAAPNVVVSSGYLDLNQYEKLGYCQRLRLNNPRPIFTRYWGGEDHDQLLDSDEQAFWQIIWNDQTLYVLMAQWETDCGGTQKYWVVAESEKVADEFLLDVDRKTNDPGEALLIYRGGRWAKSSELYQSVQRTSFDDLILPASLTSAIRNDFKQFLTSREHYEQYGLPWRRGALFIGPPGNGKTHCIRALVKELAVPTLYVQSLQHRHLPPEHVLQTVFDRARNLRPSVLILEDLDSLVNRENQSNFLNQLDGFEKNIGLIVLATTNHPELIDPAIINRPSRFDRKYHFHLPTPDLRKAFLNTWRNKIADRIQWDEVSLMQVVERTGEFSFAYLKELIISGLMAKMSNENRPFGELLLAECEFLQKQMRTEITETSSSSHR